MSSNINNQNNPIAIIGLGCLFPKAGSRQEFWHILRSGTDCIGPVPETHWSVNDPIFTMAIIPVRIVLMLRWEDFWSLTPSIPPNSAFRPMP